MKHFLKSFIALDLLIGGSLLIINVVFGTAVHKKWPHILYKKNFTNVLLLSMVTTQLATTGFFITSYLLFVRQISGVPVDPDIREIPGTPDIYLQISLW